MGRRTKARECAFQILYQWDLTREPIAKVCEAFWRLRTTTDETKEMAERLARGAHELVEPIDAAIGGAATHWRLDRIAAVDKNIMRIAAYELMREPGTPHAVILDEAVEMAKRFSEADSPPFVNGVLDAIFRKVRPQAAASAPAKS